eukprot:m.54080 g.54080  ORF g.54080 m.54080 type:complete len:67 (-) comp10898_c0_seq1:101-301(-)
MQKLAKCSIESVLGLNGILFFVNRRKCVGALTCELFCLIQEKLQTKCGAPVSIISCMSLVCKVKTS